MAKINGFLRQTHLENPTLQTFFHALDPISLVLSQNSNSNQPVPLKLTTKSFIMEKGPRYNLIMVLWVVGPEASDLALVGYGFVLNCVLGCGGCGGGCWLLAAVWWLLIVINEL